MAAKKPQKKSPKKPTAPKVMDISRPSKVAPPTTSKPVIVTNRPMIDIDPMISVSGKEPKKVVIKDSTETKTAPPLTARREKKIEPLSDSLIVSETLDETPEKTPELLGFSTLSNKDEPKMSGVPGLPIESAEEVSEAEEVVDDQPVKLPEPAFEIITSTKSKPKTIPVPIQDGDLEEDTKGESEKGLESKIKLGDETGDEDSENEKNTKVEITFDGEPADVVSESGDEPDDKPEPEIAIVDDKKEPVNQAEKDEVLIGVEADSTDDSPTVNKDTKDDKPEDGEPKGEKDFGTSKFSSRKIAVPESSDLKKPSEVDDDFDLSVEPNAVKKDNEKVELSPEEGERSEQSAEEKRHQELEAMIGKGKYFVPINQSSKKRQNAIITTVFLLLMVVLLVNLLLDAGIISVPGVPHTTLFRN